MDREVALREANQHFAEYVRAVEAGESFVITRRGGPWRGWCRSRRASAY